MRDVTTSRARRALLALYPARWRRRHGDELLGHLEDEWGAERLSARTVVDLAAAAVVERSHGVFDVVAVGERDATRGLRLLTWGWCCCVVGGIGFAKLAEHFGTVRFLPLGASVNPIIISTTVGRLAVAGDAYDAVEIVALLGAGLLALLVVPAALVAIAHGGPSARRRLGAVAALAVAISAVAVGYLAWLVVWAHELTFAQRNGGDARYALAVVGLGLLTAVALGAWTNVANVALRQVVPSLGGKSVTYVARAAALCAVVIAGGAGLWLAFAVDAPGFPHPTGLAQWPYVLAPEALLVAGAVLAVLGAWLIPSRRRGVDVAAALG